ncbi:MAG: hypothetical protein IKN81_10540 [Oscillospiraceae bacterium]|nr:hypothetical protein [Oscillospiraceae bacterium]
MTCAAVEIEHHRQQLTRRAVRDVEIDVYALLALARHIEMRPNQLLVALDHSRLIPGALRPLHITETTRVAINTRRAIPMTFSIFFICPHSKFSCCIYNDLHYNGKKSAVSIAALQSL